MEMWGWMFDAGKLDKVIDSCFLSTLRGVRQNRFGGKSREPRLLCANDASCQQQLNDLFDPLSALHVLNLDNPAVGSPLPCYFVNSLSCAPAVISSLPTFESFIRKRKEMPAIRSLSATRDVPTRVSHNGTVYDLYDAPHGVFVIELVGWVSDILIVHSRVIESPLLLLFFLPSISVD